MRFSSNRFALILILFVFTATLLAQENNSFDIFGEIRLRSELDNRDFDSESSAYNYNLLRTRLQMKKQMGENAFAVVQLQDSRTLGGEAAGATETATRSNTANVDLHLGYVRLNKLFAPWLDVQFGRMELCYGNQRLLARNNWSNTGRAFDAALAAVRIRQATIDLFAANIYESQDKAFSRPAQDDGDLSLYGAWVKLQEHNRVNSNFYVLHDRNFLKNKADDMAMQRTTIGALVQGKLDDVNWSVEANYQFGTSNFDTEIAAYYFIGSVGYTVSSAASKPAFTLTFNLLSGDDPSTSKYESFNTLYASRHRFFGYMDYFRSFPGDIQARGLRDITPGLSATPFTKLTLNADAHFFNLHQEMDMNGTAMDDLGKEIDLSLTYKLQKTVSLQAGYCLFQPGDVMEMWRGDDISSWVYVQVVAGF